MMLKLRQLIAALMTATVLVSSTTLVDAKNPPKGVSSLGTMSCQTIESGNYQAINKDFPVGLQIFKGVAMFSDRNWRSGIYKNNVNQVACRLSEAGQKPRYKTLNLAFGVADNNSLVNGSIVRLSIYRDGNSYKYQDVMKGQLLRLPIDVTNVRSIALEVECLKGSSANENYCPQLIFFQDTLQ
ncbi:hypothetical protein VB638_11570 [Dolichospermum sp. UHCC 0684]|uniref:hypothetical protein n=1 Tax=unclassified Dolichospermum TaxID=2622029 RepID=UPI001444FCB7|nr:MULTISPECIES: hypothetical protein [unclassified Dolichospermum]MEA5530215.1 hypothetical protein [Dolichospermum sp. UHCC 0684]MTJ36573.1 hypothetical protein [Dolichospermum sp. UHCC 0260]